MKTSKWTKAVDSNGMKGENFRVSKCGKFKIERRRMASARNGYWNAISYILVDLRTGKEEHFDSLEMAKEATQS